MGEVEAQAVGGHQGPRLVHVGAAARKAACRRWVAVWWRMVASRAGASTSARTTSPSEREPDSTRPRCTISSPAGAWVVRTRRRPWGR